MHLCTDSHHGMLGVLDFFIHEPKTANVFLCCGTCFCIACTFRGCIQRLKVEQNGSRFQQPVAGNPFVHAVWSSSHYSGGDKVLMCEWTLMVWNSYKYSRSLARDHLGGVFKKTATGVSSEVYKGLRSKPPGGPSIFEMRLVERSKDQSAVVNKPYSLPNLPQTTTSIINYTLFVNYLNIFHCSHEGRAPPKGSKR